MANETLKIDVNNKPVVGFVTDDASQEIRMGRIDDTTKGLKVMLAGASGGVLTPTTGQYKSFVTVGSANADYLVGSYIDIGDAINAAYAGLPSTGGMIWIDAGTYSYLTPIVFGTNGKFASLIGANAAATFLKYTPTSGTAFTMNCGNPTGHLVYELSGFTLMGKSSLVAAGQTNTNTSNGIVYGGANGAVGINTHDLNVNGFGRNLVISSNAYMLQWNNVASSGGNGGTTGNLMFINAASNSGERNVFNGCSFTDPGNSTALNAVYITNAGTASNSFSACSFDDVQVFIGASNGQTTFSNSCHFENSAFSTYPQYIPILGVSSDLSTMISMFGTEFANDGNSSGNTFQTLVKHGGQLVAMGTMINNYGGQTITNFVDHSLDNGKASDMIWGVKIQGGGLTNIVAGSGGVVWSEANGSAPIYNIQNSYSIGLRANGSNTNEFFSGSTTTASYNHTADWIFPGTVTVYGSLAALSFNTILDASQFTGSGSNDMGDKINTAYAYISTLGLLGAIITVPAGVFVCTTSINFGTNGVRVSLRGAPGGGTVLDYTSTSASQVICTVNTGIQSGSIEHTSYEAIRDITFRGSRRSSSSPAIGVLMGGSNGAAGACLVNVNIEGFGQGLYSGANTYHTGWYNGVIRNCAQLIFIAAASNSGEALHFYNGFFVDPFDATFATTNGVQLADSGSASCLFSGCSFDDTQVRIGQANNVAFQGCHFENPGSANWGAYTYIAIDNNLATNVSFNGDTFFATGSVSPTSYMSNGGNVIMNGVIVRKFTGSTMTNFASLSGSGRITWTGFNNVSGTAITNVVSGVAYTPNGFVNQAGASYILDASAIGTYNYNNTTQATPALIINSTDATTAAQAVLALRTNGTLRGDFRADGNGNIGFDSSGTGGIDFNYNTGTGAVNFWGGTTVSKFGVSNVGAITQAGKTTNYNSINTAGYGVPAIYGSGRVTAQTAAAAAIATYTVGAADGTFLVSGNINVTASTVNNFTMTCTYTDETNTSRTLTFNFSSITGTLGTAITNALGTGAYEGIPLHIRCKASTAITIATTGTFTTVTYNAEGVITQLA